MSKNYLTLKTSFNGIKGICSCGFEQSFKYDNSDIDFDDKLEGFKLQKDFHCPECNNIYTRIKRDEKEKKKSNKTFNIFAICFGLILILAIPFGILMDDSEPTFYDTGDTSDMTEKELGEYIEWQNDQNQKEQDNRKVFD